MRMKRLLALLLACAAIAGMLVFPSTAGAATSCSADVYAIAVQMLPVITQKLKKAKVTQ